MPLCEGFPGLYSIVGTKGVMVVVMWVDQGDLGVWDPKSLRPFNDWEMEAIQAFIGLTSNNSITPTVKDKMVWKGADIGCFMVKAYFRLLEGASPHLVPTKMLWNSYVPSKFGFFSWEAWWGKVLTSSHLKKRGYHLASRCPFCGRRKKR